MAGRARRGLPELRALLDRYARAFEDLDVPALTRLLTEGATWEMPPQPAWYSGRAASARFLAERHGEGHRFKLTPTRANGQPAFAAYLLLPGGAYRPRQIQVLTVTQAGITRVVAFCDATLFPTFGLPDRPPTDAGGRADRTLP